MTASSDKEPNSMLRTTALDQINKERVESGKAPLKFGKSEWDAVGKVDSLLAARASAETRQKERSITDGTAPVIVGGERVKGYEGLSGDQLRAIAEQGRQRREAAANPSIVASSAPVVMPDKPALPETAGMPPRSKGSTPSVSFTPTTRTGNEAEDFRIAKAQGYTTKQAADLLGLKSKKAPAFLEDSLAAKLLNSLNRY